MSQPPGTCQLFIKYLKIRSPSHTLSHCHASHSLGLLVPPRTTQWRHTRNSEHGLCDGKQRTKRGKAEIKGHNRTSNAKVKKQYVCMYVYSYPTTQYKMLYDRAHNKGAQVVIVITINPSHVGLFTQKLGYSTVTTMDAEVGFRLGAPVRSCVK